MTKTTASIGFLALALIGLPAAVHRPASCGRGQEPASAEDIFAGPSQGVWYCCGTANTYPGQKYVYSGPMATYCMWHRPIAVYAGPVRTTFFVFGNPDNSPAICAYDHRSKTFGAPVVLGTNPDGDAHRNPTLLVDEQGYLYVFFGAHGHPTRVVKSRSPYDLSQWEPKAAIDDPGTSYPQPWQLKRGEVFVSFRQSPGWCFRKSLDGAASWQPTVNLIRFADAAIYAVSIAATGPYPRAVHIAWSKLGGGTPEEVATKHLWGRRYDVFYARSDDGGHTWKRSDGTGYSLPIAEETADKVYESGEHGVWLKDIQLDSRGNPCILFIDADVTTYESNWKLARRAEEGWRTADVATSDHMYDGGALVILADDDFRVYAPTTPSQPHEDGGEIDEWTSTDGGATWARTRHVTAGSKYSHNHVRAVFGQEEGDFRVLWSYGDSVYPPETRDVYLGHYGEASEGARQIRFRGRPGGTTPKHSRASREPYGERPSRSEPRAGSGSATGTSQSGVGVFSLVR